MARDYARIMTAIWRNAEFCALDEGAQRLYLLLVTQPDISAAGVLPLRVPRWVDMSHNSTPEGLTQALKVLESGRFIVADWDKLELLIRSFIRWDGGYNNPKRRPVIVRAAQEVMSEAISRCLEGEFKRCGITTPAGQASVRPSDTASDAHADSLSGPPETTPTVDPKINSPKVAAEPLSPVDRLSDSVSPSDGVVVGYLGTEETTTHNPQPTPPSASGDEAPRDEAGTAQTLIAYWIDLCRKRPPGNVIGQIGRGIKSMLDEGIDPDDIRDGIVPWMEKGLHPSALPSVVNEVMNSKQRSARALPTKLATTDQRCANIQALKGTFSLNPQLLRALPEGA